MLAGVKIWALAHLLANGDLGSILLFGSILAWAVVARISVKRRDVAAQHGGTAAPAGWRNDMLAVVDRHGGLSRLRLLAPSLADRRAGAAHAGMKPLAMCGASVLGDPLRLQEAADKAAKSDTWPRTTSSFAKSTRNIAATSIAQIWQRYNGIIIGVVVLVVAGVGGWRFWQHMQQTRAQEAAARYEEALRLSSEDKGQEGAGRLRDRREGGWRHGLCPARPLPPRRRDSASRTPENGASAYDALAADAARARALEGSRPPSRRDGCASTPPKPPPLRQAVEPLAVPTNAWRHSARELLGLSGLKAGDMDYAGRWFDQIAADRETPAALRQRLAVYTALVAGGPVQVTQ